MRKATFEEYTETKKEITSGGECKEYASTDEYGRNHKIICCENGEAFWEVAENDVTEFWSTKHPDSRKYEVERELAKNAGTSMTEEDYQKLANMPGTMHLTDEQARLFIGDKLGFDPLRVKIIHEVKDYYKDGSYLKAWHTYHRDPQHNATDWDYFRFDVCARQYEYENGTLRFYNS